MKKFIKSLGIHSFLIFLSLISLFPFLWLLSAALKGSSENIFAYPPVFIPEHITFENFQAVWKKVPFLLYFFNSFITASFTVILNLAFSSMAAYPLARMNFKGKNFIFAAVLSSIMIPFQAVVLPVYLIILKLHLSDSYGIVNGYLGLILPFAVSAFGIFLMRQAFLAVPKEMEEAAFIDGCSVFKIWLKILMPMCAPSLAVLAVYTFIGSWGEFLWPGIVLSNKMLYTLPAGLNELQGFFSANWRYIAAGTVISVIPIIIFFLFTQKYFVSGQNQGALKG